MNDEYLLYAKTSDGYYLETSMLVMSTTLGATFTLIVGKNKLTLCGSSDKVQMEIQIKNLEYLHVDPSIVDTQYEISCGGKNIIIMNNKKKDSVVFSIFRDQPEKLTVDVSDSIDVTKMSIEYDLHSVETDIPLKRPTDRKLANPSVVSDSGELTKSFKILMRSCDYAEIQSQEKGIKIAPEPDKGMNTSLKPIIFGEWDPQKVPKHKVRIKMGVFKSSNKLLTLSKKIRLHCTANGFYICIFLINGLGKAVAQYVHSPIPEDGQASEEGNSDDASPSPQPTTKGNKTKLSSK